MWIIAFKAFKTVSLVALGITLLATRRGDPVDLLTRFALAVHLPLSSELFDRALRLAMNLTLRRQTAIGVTALGYALQGELPAKFLYLGHHVVVEQNHKAAIEVWTKAGKTRLYRIAYSKSAESAMDNAREQAKTGQPVLMERREGSTQEKRAVRSGGKDSVAQPMYESRIVLPSEINPKISDAPFRDAAANRTEASPESRSD